MKSCHKHATRGILVACREEGCQNWHHDDKRCYDAVKADAIVEISKALSCMSNQLQIYARR